MTNTPQDSTEQKAQVQEYFGRTADGYVTSSSHRSGKDLQRLLELGEWDSQQRVLDVATGGGHTALAVAPYVGQVTVTDLTPAMLEKAQTFLLSQGMSNAQFQVADAETLPFADASFDRVTCRIAAHHFPHVSQAVQEVARVLKPGGLFLLIDNIVPSDPALDHFANTVEKWRDASHGRAYTVEEWLSFFQQAGLHCEAQEIFGKVHDYDDWTSRAQLPTAQKAALERFILESSAAIQHQFAVTVRPDGHLACFSMQSLLLKGRKA